MTTYPEHEKMQAVQEKSQACGEFVEWFQQRGIHLAEYTTFTHTYKALNGQTREIKRVELALSRRLLQDLLAEFFGIDLQRLEAEKRAMLAAARLERGGA